MTTTCSSGSTLSARASSELLRPSPCSPALELALDLPQDVVAGGEEDLVTVERRLSWKSASASTTSESDCAATPNSELDDPFFVDVPLDVDETDIDTSYATFLAGLVVPAAQRPRRPPPLDLSRTHPYAYSAEINRWSADVELATPKSSRGHLLPALPIDSPAQYRARREAISPGTFKAHKAPASPTSPVRPSRKARSAPPPASARADPFDLLSALENLLASSGEDEDELQLLSGVSTAQPRSRSNAAYTSFPLPPPRTPLLSPASASSSSSFSTVGEPMTPRTPRHHGSLPPMPPSPAHSAAAARPLVKPEFKGDHSFLFAMSGVSANVPGTPAITSQRPDSRGSSKSVSSTSSSKQLPQRSRLPREWRQ